MNDTRRQVVAFSGGRSSAYMLHILTTEEPDPDRLTLFYNTGKERAETLDFVAEVADRWEIDITWLEYDYNPDARGTKNDPRHVYKIVTRETASTNGEPFEKLINASRFIPNLHRRRCTQELKVKTAQRFLKRHHGLTRGSYVENLGIRYDEPRRWQRAMTADDCRIYYPLVPRRVTQETVAEFWAAQPFDLGIPSDRGNCDLCFLKGAQNLVDTIEENPAAADWWIEQERKTGRVFNDRHSYRELLHQVTYRQLVQADQCHDLPLFDNQPAIDCYCGD